MQEGSTRQLIRMNNQHRHQQQPSPQSDSDATGASEGADYHFQMYFRQSHDGISAQHQPGRQVPPTRIAEEAVGGVLGEDDDSAIGDVAHRIKLDAEIASILFGIGTDEENQVVNSKFPSANSSQSTDPKPAAFGRLTREAPSAASEYSSSGPWHPDSSQDPGGQQQPPSHDHAQPTLTIRNIQQARLSKTDHGDAPARISNPGSSTSTRGTTGSSENGKREKITQTQTGLDADSSKENSLPAYSNSDPDDNFPIKFHQDHFNTFLSLPSSSPSPSSISSSNKNNNNHHHLENHFPAEYNLYSSTTAARHTPVVSSGGTTSTIVDLDQDLGSSSSTNLLNHPISSSSISPDSPYQFSPHVLHSYNPFEKFDYPFNPLSHPPLDPIRPPFDVLDQMNTSSHPPPKSNPPPLDLSEFWSTFTPPTQIESAQTADQLTSEGEERPKPFELEFSHLVAEEQCAPSTPLSSSSFSYEPLGGVSSSSHSSRSIHQRSPKCSGEFSTPFNTADPLSSLFPTADQGTSLYPTPHHQSISNFQDFRDLNDTFHNLINSFDLLSPPASSAPRQSISSSVQPSPLSAPFLSATTQVSTQSTPGIDHAFGSQLQSSPPIDNLAHNKFEPSIQSTSPLPSPISLSYPSVPTPQSSHQDRIPPSAELGYSNHPPHVKSNLIMSRSASYSALHKVITAAAEVPTEAEIAIPRHERLNFSEPYPHDLKLLLIGLQAEGAKTRVETQIKLTLVLVTGEGASIDQDGNLSTTAQHSLSRVGNWSHIKLPVYSAIKRKSKKLIKTGIPPEETLFLEVAVVRESEPHEEIYCCSNCQVREQKRLQRKRDARVRPAQEIESDEAEQSMRPEDEKRKIVVFNCGQYVSFDSGEVTLPTRITCYCRHHREKKGFRVKIDLRDHTGRFVASSTTPAIMITDDHKAVAAAAKAKPGSDVEDSQVRTRPIRKLPNAGPAGNTSGVHRSKKKSQAALSESTSNIQLVSTPAQDNGGYDSATGWAASFPQNDNTACPNPIPRGKSRSTSMKCKRKAPDELNLRANIGRRTGSNQTATSNQLAGLHDDSLAHGNADFRNYLVIHPPASARSLDDSKHHLAHQQHSQPYDRSISMPMPIIPPDMRRASSASKYQWEDYPPIPRQSYLEQMSIFQRHEARPTLSVDVKMEDSNQNAPNRHDSQHTDNPLHSPFQSLSGNIESRSIDYSAPSDLAETPHNDLDSIPSTNSGQGDQAHMTFRQYQNAYSRLHTSCSTRTSSPDQILTCPFGTRIATPAPSGSSEASPESSGDSQGYDHQAKFSNSTSRSSSIGCTQSRGCSDRSSNTSEVDRTICILPCQSENIPDQQPAEQTDTHSNDLDATSRAGSPANESPMCMLGSALSNWNVLPSISPQNSLADASPKSPTAEVPSESHGGGPFSAQSMLDTDRSAAKGSDPKKARAQIRKLVPNEGPIEGGIEITILGENFDRDLRVDFGGSSPPVRPEFWSANTLVCTLPASTVPGPCESS
ncbi:hypothetical protein H4Q26_017727 [Puccinia striiformis f. sp. tritici PST-130]|nr:hypothetical protein H4Q26_017727 [Puccinia striiformis f. sp. tritici PST-130]